MELFYAYIQNNCENKHNAQHRAGREIIQYAAINFFGIKDSEIEIINKKPIFKYNKNIHFSIAHTEELAAVCFDNNDIGLDIEKIKQRNYISVSKRMRFNLEENTLECFYKHWTMYEAEYKLHKTPKSGYSFIFNNDYAVSIVSNSVIDIKTELNIHPIKI